MKKKKPKKVISCEFSTICPAINKCRISGVFTRYNTNNCACRDFKKERKEWITMT